MFETKENKLSRKCGEQAALLQHAEESFIRANLG